MGHTLRPPTLEEVLTAPEWFGLATASQGQLALCRMSQGMPLDGLEPGADGYPGDISDRSNMGFMLGGGDAPTQKPLEVFLLAGIRCGKSLIAAALAVFASQNVDVRSLRPGERCRFSIVSLDKDKARAVLMHLYGAVEHSVRVRQLVVGEVRTDGVDLRHPSGTIVEIRVTAGKRAGGGLVSYWSAGVVFDEAPRMVGEDEGVVNFDASRKAVLGRLLPGAQLWAIGSPWAPIGPVYQAVESYWGKPGAVLVMRAPAPLLNPVYWTPERCEHVRLTDEESYRMDVLGEWGTPEMAMFTEEELRAVMRDYELPPEDGMFYYAAMDPAAKSNAFTLVLGGIRRSSGLPTISCARQWVPKKENKTIGEVLGEIAELCKTYRVEHIYTDQWSADAIIELGRLQGVTIVEEQWANKNKVKAFDSLRVAVREGKIQLCNAPSLMNDMLRVKRQLTNSGVAIHFPETADGRHCDFAPAIAMWAAMHKQEPVDIKVVRSYYEEEEERMERESETSTASRYSFRRAR